MNRMRRSARLQGRPTPEKHATSLEAPTTTSSSSAKAKARSTKRTSVPCKLLQCDVAKVRGSAGVEIAPTKDPVVRWMLADGDGSVDPSYNRISGVLEWENAVVLWVNIDDDSKYANIFADNGETLRLTWFGASHHRLESPVVQKMLHLSKADACFLFCRYKGGEYFCCGRLIYITIDGGEGHGGKLQIEWLLVDRNRMLETLNAGGAYHPFSDRLEVDVKSELVLTKEEQEERAVLVKQEAAQS